MATQGEFRQRRGKASVPASQSPTPLPAEEETAESSLVSVLTEGVLGFLLWSSVWHIAPCLWLIPLDAMGVTGWEGAVLIWILMSPLVGLGFVQRLFGSPLGLFVLRCAGLACSFGAYPLLPPEAKIMRYLLLVVGTTFLFMAWSLQLWGYRGRGDSQRQGMVGGLMIGLFSTLALRAWFRSLHPVFVYDVWGYAALVAGGVCSVQRLVALWGQTYSWQKPVRRVGPGLVVSSMSAASVFWLTGYIFGDISVLSRWVGSGHPDTGPSPNPWGIAVILSLAFGVVGLPCLANFFLWWLIGCTGAAVMYFMDGAVGYAAGLVFAMYLGSVFPQLLSRFSQHAIGRSMLLFSLTFCLSVVFAVWTTAYNFVPGGEATRERSHVLILAGMILLAFATCVLGKTVTGDKKSEDECDASDTKELLRSKHLPRKTMIVIGLLVLVAICGVSVRFNAYNPQASERTAPEFTAAIWTVHFGIDNYGRNSFDHMAELIRNSGADVIGLLETDTAKPFLGNHDLAMYLGEVLGMYTDFGPGPRHHTWGCLLLSRYPIIKSQHLLLPSPHGEIAPAIHATLLIAGQHVDVMVVHMGVDSDDLDRKLQARTLAVVLRAIENPAFFLGYITCSPGGRDYMQISRDGNMTDIDSTEKKRWCEYIFYRDLIRQGFARITHGSLTDTEMQLAKFKLRTRADEKDNDLIVYETDRVPPRLRFPEMFGERRFGHHTARFFLDHVFHMNTPRYFVRS